MSTNSTLLRANLRTHGRRYVATGLAVLISTAFILITLIVMGGLTTSLQKGVYNAYEGGTVSVSLKPQESQAYEDFVATTTKAKSTIRALPGVRALNSQAHVMLEITVHGERANAFVDTMSPEPFHQPKVTTGTLPEKSTDITLPSAFLTGFGLKVGDKIQARPLGSDADYTTVRVTGFFDTPYVSLEPPAGAIRTDSPLIPNTSLVSSKFLVATTESALAHGNPSEEAQKKWATTVSDALTDIPGVTVTTVAADVERDLKHATVGIAAVTAMMLTFPGIAALVAAIVVSSTFKVVLQQRRRELALLRTLGSTGAQVRRLVTLEALAIGAISSLLGVIIGALLGTGALRFVGVTTSYVEALTLLSPTAIGGVWLFGTLFTLLVGLRPALSVSRVSPMAALQPVNESGTQARSMSLVRLVFSLLLSIVGGAAIIVSLRMESERSHFLGAFGGALLTLLGLLFLCSVLMPYMTAALGRLWPGMLSRMARGNVLRNPGRTAATGTAIVIGVTLVVTMMVGASSLRTTLTSHLDKARPVDAYVTTSEKEISADLAQKITHTDGVEASENIYATMGTITVDGLDIPFNGEVMFVLEGQPDYSRVAHSPITPLADDRVQVGSEELKGRTLHVCATSDGAQKCRDLTAEYVSTMQGQNRVVVSRSTLNSLSSTSTLSSVVLRMKDGTQSTDLQKAITKLDSHLTVGGAAFEREIYTKVIDGMLLALVALLGVSVVVALVGVSNTLSLSVAERTRENGLLRALGLTRRQMKNLLALEALFMSITGAVVGTAFGILFGWVGLLSLPLRNITPILTIPWWQLGAVLVIAILSALVSSWLPGRRAAKVSPSEALATE